jgi:hypothetical protein
MNCNEKKAETVNVGAFGFQLLSSLQLTTFSQ